MAVTTTAPIPAATQPDAIYLPSNQLTAPLPSLSTAVPVGRWLAPADTDPPKSGGKKPLPFSPTIRIGLFMLIVAAGFTALSFIAICVLMALGLTATVAFTYLTMTFFVAVLAMIVATILLLAGGILHKQK